MKIDNRQLLDLIEEIIKEDAEDIDSVICDACHWIAGLVKGDMEVAMDLKCRIIAKLKKDEKIEIID